MRPAVALAFLLSIAPVVAAGPAAAQTPAPPASGVGDQAAALTRFQKGRVLLSENKYAEAVVEFRAAAEIIESPNTRLYVARCEKELGHLARASVEFQRAATEASDRAATDLRYAETANAARQEGAAIEPGLGHLVINGTGLPSDVVLTVNGATLSASALGVAAPADPGRVMVTAAAKGYKPYERSVKIAAGELANVTIALEADTGPAPGDAPGGDITVDESGRRVRRVGGGLRAAGYVIGGAGVVGMVLFTAFAVLAQTRFNQLQNECGNHCGASYQSSIDEGKGNQTIANVSLVAGGSLLVAGIVMIAVGGPKTVPADAKATESTRLSRTPDRREGSVMHVQWAPLLGPSVDGRGFTVGVSRAF